MRCSNKFQRLTNSVRLSMLFSSACLFVIDLDEIMYLLPVYIWPSLSLSVIRYDVKMKYSEVSFHDTTITNPVAEVFRKVKSL